jgi:hypothetical protein
MLISYAREFYNEDGSKANVRDKTGYYDHKDLNDAFEKAFLSHTKYSKHHWQYWVMPRKDTNKLFAMDKDSIVEMICDWISAGKNQGNPDTVRWWDANNGKMLFHPDTRRIIEEMIEDIRLKQR